MDTIFKSDKERKAAEAILFPKAIESVAIKPSENSTNYLGKCERNLKAELWGLFKTKTEKIENLETFSTYEIHVNRNGVYVIEPPSYLSTSEEVQALDKLKELAWNVVIFKAKWCLLYPQNRNDEFSLLVIQGCDIPRPKTTRSHFRPQPVFSSQDTLLLVNFVRPYFSDYVAILEQIEKTSAIIPSLASPALSKPFSYMVEKSDLSGGSFSMNAGQQDAIKSLSTEVEGIQGPPGTGKSSTIYHITRLVPFLARVTCVQNKALDAIAEKLEDNIPFIVFGSPKNLGVAANRNTLEQQIKDDFMTFHAQKQKNMASNVLSTIKQVLNWYDNLLVGNEEYLKAHCKIGEKKLSSWIRLWSAFVRKSRKFIGQDPLGEFFDYWDYKVDYANKKIHRVKIQVETEIIMDAQALLSTVDSIHLMDEVIERATSSNSRMLITILDEAGTIPEFKLPKLVSFKTCALIAIGDQKQLRPFSNCDGPASSDGIDGFFHRLAKAKTLYMLTEQYRMRENIGNFISSTFYEGKLTTSALLPKGGKIQWLQCNGRERGESSKENPAEVDKISDLLLSDLRFTLSTKSVMIITFYKKQFFNLLDMAEKLGLSKKNEKTKKREFTPPTLRIVTVDSAQGSEADIVILSCVRSNDKRSLGFVTAQDRMCVALSRAREKLIIVGNSSTMSANPIYKSLYQLAEKN